jgi:predicted amidohydrolase YtcJ
MLEAIPMRVLPIMFASAVLMAQPQATLVLVNGNIRTMSAAQPHADAVAVLGSRIVAVGGNDEVKQWIGPGTRVVDLHGRLVVPGFNDAHVHFFYGGQALASVQLRSAGSPEEFRDRIAKFAATLPAGRWILNGEWDHENWTPARLPTRQLIDAVTGDRPVFVSRLDGHMGLANTVALKLAGIDRYTPDPAGGAIVRDERGEPTGILKDAAIDLIARVIPAPHADEIAEAVRAAMRYAAENGVTSVQEMANSSDASPSAQKFRRDVLAVYQNLLRAGELNVRISVYGPLALWEQLAAAGVTAPFGGEKLQIGGLKGYADGSLGSSTALLFHPYLDAPQTSGLAAEDLIPVSKMQDRIIGADAAGLQVAIHAIGDKANATILDLYQEAERHNGPRDRRFRIEHAQHLRQQDISRFAALHVIASMQPIHLADDGRWAEKRVGPEVIGGTYAFRSLLDSGATLVFGSDWPVAPMVPLAGIEAAVTRRTLDGKHPDGWVPEQKISVEEAVRAFTVGSAYASFDEKIKGSVAVGKLADLAVISADIFKIAPKDIGQARVDMTIFDGRVIYDRGQ